MFRHPKAVDSLNVFLAPFECTVWLSIFALGVCSALIVRHIFSVENHEKVKDSINNGNINEDSYSNTALMVFGFIFQQSNALLSVLLCRSYFTYCSPFSQAIMGIQC